MLATIYCKCICYLREMIVETLKSIKISEFTERNQKSFDGIKILDAKLKGATVDFILKAKKKLKAFIFNSTHRVVTWCECFLNTKVL